MHAPGHLQRIVIHINHAFSDRQGTAVSASHVHKASVRVVDYEVELEVFDQICYMCQRILLPRLTHHTEFHLRKFRRVGRKC